MTAVNTLFNLLLTSKNFKELDFSNFKFSVGGGMAVMSETAKNWKKITGTNITQGYGLTETSPVVSINKIDSLYNGSIGLPVQSTNIKIINENGEKINDKQPGELCVRRIHLLMMVFLKREISLLLTAMGILLLLIEKKI
jgi:long-chain acyl-CoA synthetase